MKLLLTGAFRYTDAQLEQLKNLGYEVSFMQDEKAPLTIEPGDIEAVVCNALFLYHDISLFKKLKIIQLTSAGLDRVPIDQIKEKNIHLFSAEDVYSIPMAEWAVLKILELYKGSRQFHENQMNKEWKKKRDVVELSGRRVAIIGFGSVGTEIAKRLKAFGVYLTGVGRKPLNPEILDEYLTIDQFNRVLQESDVVILTLPLTAQTRYLMDVYRLSLMKKESILINISRGSIIDEKALVAECRNGKFLGVALDVFENEPLPKESALWELDQVLITPHNSFISDQTRQRLFTLIVKNLSFFPEKV